MGKKHKFRTIYAVVLDIPYEGQLVLQPLYEDKSEADAACRAANEGEFYVYDVEEFELKVGNPKKRSA